mmetsp:Transcript_24224/g.54474  ORF Transcript_24224/g.54474 Transcript_24224/m.54474 type:complete len:258 (+) Transcript_24224:746-1519(+)
MLPCTLWDEDLLSSVRSNISDFSLFLLPFPSDGTLDTDCLLAPEGARDTTTDSSSSMLLSSSPASSSSVMAISFPLLAVRFSAFWAALLPLNVEFPSPWFCLDVGRDWILDGRMRSSACSSPGSTRNRENFTMVPCIVRIFPLSGSCPHTNLTILDACTLSSCVLAVPTSSRTLSRVSLEEDRICPTLLAASGMTHRSAMRTSHMLSASPLGSLPKILTKAMQVSNFFLLRLSHRTFRCSAIACRTRMTSCFPLSDA